jgi:hypothetical protein
MKLNALLHLCWVGELMKDIARGIWVPVAVLVLVVACMFGLNEVDRRSGEGRDTQTQSLVKENADRLERIETELARRRVELNEFHANQRKHEQELSEALAQLRTSATPPAKKPK